MWLRGVASLADGKALDVVLDDILDGVLDKAKETRSAATDLLEIVVNKGRIQVALERIARRRPTDANHLRSMVEALSGPKDTSFNQRYSPPEQAASEDRPSPDVPNTGLSSASRAALANRRNALVLGKPKLDANGKPLPKYNAKSSIPKPIPLPRPSKTPLFRVPDKSALEKVERGTTSGLFIGEGGREVPSMEEPATFPAPAPYSDPVQPRPVDRISHIRAESFVSFSEVENQEPLNGASLPYPSAAPLGNGGEIVSEYHEDSFYQQPMQMVMGRVQHDYQNYNHRQNLRQFDELSLNSNEPRDEGRMIMDNEEEEEEEEESEGLGPLPHFPFAGGDSEEEEEDGNGFGMNKNNGYY